MVKQAFYMETLYFIACCPLNPPSELPGDVSFAVYFLAVIADC
jgi:hypothetical protein